MVLSPCSRGTKTNRPAPRQFRPRLDILEDRCLLSLGDLLQTIANPTPGYAFGNAQATSGNLLVVGAPSGNTGAVHLFDSGTGNLLQTLNNPNASNPASFAGDNFGGSVAVSGNYVVVGAPGEDIGTYDAGVAYVYDAATGALVRTLNNPAPAFGAGFGFAVAVSGTKAVVGRPYPNTTSSSAIGSAYVFDVTTGALLGALNNPAPAANDRFGAAVAIDGNYVVIGAPTNTAAVSRPGVVYVFDAATRNLVRTIANPGIIDATAKDSFGASLAVSGTRLLVGAPNVDRPDVGNSINVGAAYEFDVMTGSLVHTWNNPYPRDEIGSATNGEVFGASLAIYGDRVVIGAPGDDNQRGAGYVYSASTGALLRTLYDPTRAGLERFAGTVAVSGSRVVAASSQGVRVFDAGTPLVVTTNADNGNDASPIAGSLRQAIHLANGTPGLDVIDFNLAPGARTINLAGGLPAITDAVIINGTTAPGGVPLIELSGANASAWDILDISANNCLVRGLVINGFTNTGIAITGNGNVVQGNYVGTNAAGTAAVGHGSNGIVMVDASNNRIECNVVSGTGVPGSVQGTPTVGVSILQLTGNAQANTIAGNKIGTSADGTALVPNENGVFIGGGARSNIVEGNLISGNTWAGVQIAGDVGIPQAFVTSGNIVRGNTITGNFDGVEVGAGPGFVFDGATWSYTVPTLGTKNNTVQDNVISNNRQYGVVIDGIRADNNLVYHNTIQGNTSYGVAITGGAQGNTIGSAGALANTISGNGGGVLLRNLGTDFFPGYDFFIANHPDSPTGNSVVPVLNNAIRGNSITGNAGLAIDLNGDGVTVNDLGDADAGGPNGLQNFPVMFSASAGAGGLTVTGSFDGAPSTGGLVIDFYASPQPHASGFGGGATFLGSTTVATDGSGHASFSALLPAVSVGQYITGLVTSPTGSTSEFSAAIRVVAENSGVTAAEENAAPNGGDGNNDGILDSLQASVASLQDAVSGAYLTLEAPDGTTLAAVQTVTDPSTDGAPEGVEFPVGLVQFALTGVTPGSAQTVTLYLPAGVTATTYYKYGPTADDPSPHWYEFLYDGVTGAELFADRVVLHLVDGDRGDDDGLANGAIVDPGSPAVLSNTVTTVTASSGFYGDTVTFVAQVSALEALAGTPTGSVQFYVDGSAFGAPLSLVNGAASISLPALPAGAYAATAVYVSDDPDFQASTASAAAVATLNPAPLTVTANNVTRTYGGADPAFTVSYSGFVLGQDASVLGGTLAFSTPASATSDVGIYTLTPGGLTSANYSISYADGTLTIDPAALTVTANDAWKAAGEPNPTFTASYAGFVLGQDPSVLEGELLLVTIADADSPAGNYPIEPLGLSAQNYDITFVPGALHIVANVELQILRSDVNLASNGVIAVAIFTTASFDAATVNASSVVFAGARAVDSALADADGDGDLDLVLHFRTQDTNLRALYEQLLADDINSDGVLDSNQQTAEVSLTGQTVDEVFFEGFDQLDLFLSGKALRQMLAELAAVGAI